ncbi:MAG: GDSL-type esterase/lipase family protein [Cyanobacteria bacterium J06638_22]
MNNWLRRSGDRHLRGIFRQGRARLRPIKRQVQWSWRHWKANWKLRRSLSLRFYIALAGNMIRSLFSGSPHRLTYKQWVELFAKEAEVSVVQQPERLTILLGDSISTWFPNDLLLSNRSWLNQGIPGDDSTGLLRRLKLLDPTSPTIIFLMIGINALLRGASDDLILSNHRQIIGYLKTVHPATEIVVQLILPHAAAAATFEGRDRLLVVPNQRIIHLNRELEAIATESGVDFLDLYPLFTDDRGNLPMNLSTDGLHLSREGYRVWRFGLQMYFQEIATSKANPSAC